MYIVYLEQTVEQMVIIFLTLRRQLHLSGKSLGCRQESDATNSEHWISKKNQERRDERERENNICLPAAKNRWEFVIFGVVRSSQAKANRMQCMAVDGHRKIVGNPVILSRAKSWREHLLKERERVTYWAAGSWRN